MTPSEIAIAGEGCSLLLRVVGYAYPNAAGRDDANWLRAEVDLRASLTGSFRDEHDVSLRAEELADFHTQLRELLDSLSGEAALEHIEQQFGCTVTLNAGVGELEAFVREEVGAELRVSEVRTDQSFLQQTLRQLEVVIAAFPVRGETPSR